MVARRRRMALAFALAACPAVASGQAGQPAAAANAAIAQARSAMLGDPALAQEKAIAAEQASTRVAGYAERELSLGTAEWLQGEALLRLGRVTQAAPVIDAAFRRVNARQPGSDLNGEVALTRGRLHAAQGRVASALADYHAAFAIFRRAGDKRNQAIALVTIALLYSDGNDYATADRYFQQALGLYSGDPHFTFAVESNLAANYHDAGDYAAAEAEYRRSLALARSLHSPLLVARLLGNMARMELKLEHVDQAAIMVRQAQAVVPSDAGKSERASLLSIAAEIDWRRDQLPVATALLDHAFDGIDLATTTPQLRDAHQAAVEVYRAAGRTAEALAHLTALKRLDDETTQVATSTATALAGARFDFANQEARIANLRAEQARRSLESERTEARLERTIFVGAVIATVLVITLLGIALLSERRSRARIARVNDDLAATNAALGKALAAKTEFLATTSHEIRTPLNGILGMTQVMLADPGLPPATRDRLAIVKSAGVTMRALVDDILDVAKMETGNMTVERVAFDLCATVGEAGRLWEEQAAAKGLRFATELTQCPARVMGDPARVRQIVFNLLSNALKFTEAGEVVLRATSIGDRVRVSVSDTGIGIPSDTLEHIFESFRQADTSTTRRFGGTGLGLAICRNLARAMDGEVTVSSVAGQGSTFTLDLPLLAAEEAEAPAAATGAGQVLIADRNPISRAMLKTLVEREDYRGLAVADAEAATAAAGDAVAAIVDDAIFAEDEETGQRLALAGALRRAGAPVAWLLPAGREQTGEVLRAIGVTVLVKPVSGSTIVRSIRSAQPPLVSTAA